MGIAGALGSEVGLAEGMLAAEPPAVDFTAGRLAVGLGVGVPPRLAIGVSAGVLAVGRLAVGS